MKVLLINPCEESFMMNSRLRIKTFHSPIPPLGLAYIATVLKDNCYSVFIIDQLALHLSNEDLLERIAQLSPDVIGISCLTAVMTNVKFLCKEIKTNASPLIVLGNIHPTLLQRRY
jgi:magnesium-protoporphyrin IX monomethyl ester (oxidative) cyclase